MMMAPWAIGSALLAAAPAPAATPPPVRMASPFPEGSAQHLVLKETAEKWKSLSGGRVTLRVFAGGVAGDDPDVVRKMEKGTLGAGILNSLGLAAIDKSVLALSVPLLYDSYEEVYAVHEKMRPRLEAGLAARGFVVLNWADGGWVRFFTRRPAAVPGDLRTQKLFSPAGDTELEAVWRAAGFDPVPLPTTEIASALQTGAVDAVGCPPQIAVVAQVFTKAPHMTDLRWQLLLGATVITKAAWDQVPADLRPALQDAAREGGRRLREEVKAREAKDVEAMRKRGLTVVPVSPKQRAEWQKLTEAFYPRIRGEVVPADAFDEAMRFRDEYRKRR